MKIICAPDSFKESLSAVDVADAMAMGILSVLPDAVIDRCPAGDGGSGTLESLLVARSGERVCTEVVNALGSPVEGCYGKFEHYCWVETAAAIGLDMIPASERDVMASSSFGAGELLVAALASGVPEVVVGVGGSATNDGGCGLAQALGVRFYDESGSLIEAPIAGNMLRKIRSIDLEGRIPVDASIKVACDVDNPLTGEAGASNVFGPQKGATSDEVRILDDGLGHLAAVLRRDTGIDVEHIAGAGAAGGLGAGLVVFAGAEIIPGADAVLNAIDFDTRLKGADLCLTGEGRLDGQSLGGKTCIGVARRAAAAGVPVIALAGSTGPDANRCLEAGITEYIETGKGLPEQESMSRAAELIAAAAANVAGRFV